MPDPTNDQLQSQGVNPNNQNTTEYQDTPEYQDTDSVNSASRDIVDLFETDVREQMGLNPEERINIDLQTKEVTEAQFGEIEDHSVDMLEVSQQDTDVDSA